MFYRNLFRLFFYILMVPVVILLVLAGLGYMAIFHGFWPPSCKMLPPIPQAVRVCEFSKLEKNKAGTPAEVVFWVSVPYITPAADKIYLAIDGKDPILMDKVGEYSYQTKLPAVTGQGLSYYYRRNSEKSLSEKKSYTVKMLAPTKYDYVSAWSDQPNAVSLPLRTGIKMMDTWTINYNFNFFEDTRRNLDSAFIRAKAAGAKEVGVYSFIEALGDKNSLNLQEVKSSYKYMRDAAISAKDMKLIAETAKKYNLDVVLHYNIEADYTKYFKVTDVSLIGAGVGGDAAHKKAAEELGVNEPKSELWLDMWFYGLSGTLTEWGRRAEENKIYGIDITPQYLVPDLGPSYGYADQRYADLIANLSAVYHGKIFASTFSNFGGLEPGKVPAYLQKTSGLYVYGGPIKVKENGTVEEMKQAHLEQLRSNEALLKDYKNDKFWVLSQASYHGVTAGKPGFEFNDYSEALAAGNKADWQEQANSYEAFLQALNGNTFYKGFASSGYWYDDFMDPKYADPLISMHPSIRNKPAEAVWQKWVLAPKK